MKKLLMALGVVASAACAQAAAVKWEVTGTEAEVNYSVYLLVGDVATTTWSSAADVAKAAIDKGTLVDQGRENYGAVGTAINASLTKTTSFYYVIVSADSTKYAVSDLYPGSSYVYNNDNTSGTPETSPATASFAANTASYSSFSGSVPEPTSGLLMLVGLAGLALRRKRA